MNVLFCIRPDCDTNIAGDSIQMNTMANYLRNRDVNVSINTGMIKDFSKYDIIHLFNLTRISEIYQYYKIAKKQNKKIVITPIYWNLKKYYSYEKNDFYCKLWEMNQPFRTEILCGCDMIYPSSLAEMLLLKSEFGETIPCTIIPNCIDTTGLQPNENNDKKNSFILCAARICPRKNQLTLADICNRLGEKLVLAGNVTNQKYLNRCLQYENVTYIGNLKSNELSGLYQTAKLHILCSFVETPGLSSLEAGAHGCNIVSTSEGSAEEYFKDMALYCDPYNSADIYNSIKLGLSFNKQPLLQKYIIENFNIEKSLTPLYDSYFKL